MNVNPKQLDAVFALPGPKRFEHFVKAVADWQQVWGLFDDGWALCATDDGTPVFPVWPAQAYARACAIDEWRHHEPRAMALDEFLDELLPRLRQDGVLPGVLFTPAGQGVTPSIDELVAAIQAEADRL